jgi:hypothetical protein
MAAPEEVVNEMLTTLRLSHTAVVSNGRPTGSSGVLQPPRQSCTRSGVPARQAAASCGTGVTSAVPRVHVEPTYAAGWALELKQSKRIFVLPSSRVS